MSISAAELSAEVLGNLELDASVTADVARFKIYENLSAAQLHLINILPIQYLRDGIKTTLVKLLKDEAEYQWPVDFCRFIALWLDFGNPIIVTGASTNHGKRVTEYDADRHHQPIKSIGTTTYPFVDVNSQDGYIISPAPTAEVIDGGRLRYVYKPPNIAVAQDSALNPNLKNLLIYKATEMSALIDQYRPDLADRFKGLYRDELQGFLPKEEPDK